MLLDKSKIKANFNQAHQSYNPNAILQKIVAKNLVELAKKDISYAKNIIDLGSATGFIAEEILSKFSDKKIFQLDIAHKMLIKNPFSTHKIIADIEALPLRENSFDLVLSSLSFQWLNNLEKAIDDIFSTIKNDGNLYFSILGNKSLQELRSTCQNCQINLSINNFITQDQLQKILTDLHLNYQIKSETISLCYPDLYLLLKSIKSIGAGYSTNKNYLGKKQFDLLNSFYLKNFNLNNKIFTTWQVFYVSIKHFKYV